MDTSLLIGIVPHRRSQIEFVNGNSGTLSTIWNSMPGFVRADLKEPTQHEQEEGKDQSGRASEDAGGDIDLTRAYRAELHMLQIELVKLQRHFIGCGDRILVLLEGRDSAGKDGCIKRIAAHLSPRETRIVALGKPSDREQRGWYFQRYVPHLPVAEELVLFNRSWYNRAGVELVMGFCTQEEHEEFMQSVPKFEEILVNSGIKLLKYYLDIGKDEQKQRLAERKRDPLKQWKSSPIDAVAVKHWKDYSKARDAMLLRTHTGIAPWRIVRTDDKRLARLNLIRDILSRLHYDGKKNKLVQPDANIAFEFTPDCIQSQRLAR